MKSISMLAVVLFCSTLAFAQTNKGGISGTVTDQNGAAIPNATVTLTNLGTNKALTVTTSSSGTFSFSPLDPVTYQIVVEATGFKKAILEKLKVDTALISTANFSLETGAVAETVTVSSEANLIPSGSGTTA
ncbi:MAG TPA: carboxypeptidase-like regulatory domain-containing protein, partial [Pyrinomonadaceae bacterium]|nr:carboxypeptidase-like regulatory domain-containing protein [Pyrinomonadaceae bacterium]